LKASSKYRSSEYEAAPAARGRHKRGKTKCAARGKRYSKAVKKAILKLADDESPERAVEMHGVTLNSIMRWRKERERRAPAETKAPMPTRSTKAPRTQRRDFTAAAVEATASVPTPPAKKPRPYARDFAVVAPMLPKDERHATGLVEPEDEVANDPRRREILRVWREHPGFGPSQVRNLIRRNGLKASVTTVRAVMEENGYVAPKHVPKEHTGSYEAARPRELYHLDFNHFHVHKQKQCLLFIEDDFSRFIVGWALVPVEAADPVVTAFERCVARPSTAGAACRASRRCSRSTESISSWRPIPP